MLRLRSCDFGFESSTTVTSTPHMRRFLPYLRRHPHRVGYLGWTGHENLGDEALAEAVEALVGGLQLVEVKVTSKTRVLERARFGRGLFKGVILGGGTLINARATFDAFAGALERYPTGAVFGTGVLDPDYWSSVPGFVDDREAWAELLDGLPLVSVRGPESRRLLVEAGLSDVEVIGDPALTLADDAPTPRPGRRRIGFNVGTSRGRVWGSEPEIADWAVRCIDALASEGWEVVLVPVWTEDLSFVDDVASRTRTPVHVHRDYLDLDATLELLRSCDVFVGQKLHSVVLAHCVYTPAFALAYRPKCIDYMASMDLLEHTTRTDRLCVDRVLDEAERLLENGPAHQCALSMRIEGYRKVQRDFGARTAALYRSSAYPRVA